MIGMTRPSSSTLPQRHQECPSLGSEATSEVGQLRRVVQKIPFKRRRMSYNVHILPYRKRERGTELRDREGEKEREREIERGEERPLRPPPGLKEIVLSVLDMLKPVTQPAPEMCRSRGHRTRSPGCHWAARLELRGTSTARSWTAKPARNPLKSPPCHIRSRHVATGGWLICGPWPVPGPRL